MVNSQKKLIAIIVIIIFLTCGFTSSNEAMTFNMHTQRHRDIWSVGRERLPFLPGVTSLYIPSTPLSADKSDTSSHQMAR